jgi:hypothetical protein
MGIQQQFGGGGGVPWNYPMDFQQAAMMGYPGVMQRTSSNQSMGGISQQQQQQFFGWGPMGFGHPMTQQEMEILARRDSESSMMWGGQQSYPQQQQQQPHQRPPSVTQSQPVTPQGSFRRKSRPPAFQHEEQRQQRYDPDMDINSHRQPYRFNDNQQILNNQRPTTPRSLSRMNPSPIHFQETLRDLEEDAMLEFHHQDDPEGPWTCKHCTFINPKSLKICTICCKTHQSSQGPEMPRKGSSSSTNDNEDLPVIQSKLSISRGEKQQATINLIESVERVRTPTSKENQRRPPPPSPANNNSNRSNKIIENQRQKVKGEEEDEEEDGGELDDAEEQELINKAQHHQIKINTKKPKIISARSNMNDSNEDVFGIVPVQALTISPKIGTN